MKIASRLTKELKIHTKKKKRLKVISKIKNSTKSFIVRIRCLQMQAIEATLLDTETLTISI